MVFIAVVGNIGVGKSTLVKKIAERFGFRLFIEKADSPLLAKFYKDMEKGVKPSENAYLLQLHYLLIRATMHLDMQHYEGDSVQDRTIYEDATIFAKHQYELGFISNKRYKDYLDIFEKCVKSLREPDLLIFLTAPVDVLKERIKKRLKEDKSRVSEKPLLNPKNNYLKDLNESYFHFMNNYGGEKILIPSSDFNFVDNPRDLEIVLDKIREKIFEK
jgi:deoxyadenosine/deoxycytidine kinase